MERFFKLLNTDREVVSVLSYENYISNVTYPPMIEITEEEYNILLAEIESANQPEESETDEISDSEALAIILGGEV